MTPCIPKNNTLFSKFLLLSAMLLIFVQTITAQNANVIPFATGGGVPGIPQGLTGPQSVGSGSTTNYSITTLSTVPTYTWKVNPSNAATSVIWGYGYCSVTWSSSYSGSAQVSVSGVNSVGTGSPANLTVQVGGYPPITPGSLSPTSQTIAYNTTPAKLTTSLPSGGNGTFNYNWQISTDGGNTYNSVGAPSLTTYTPPALTATTMYKVVYSSTGVPNVASTPVVVNVNPPTFPKNVDVSFNNAMNNVFGKLNTANIPTGILRDYGMEFTNIDAYNGVSVVDSNLVDISVFSQIYATLAMARLGANSYATLPSPNMVDSLRYLARQPGQVVLNGLYYQYSYLNTTVNPNPNINISNGQLTDKYVNGVWQNPYQQSQTLAFAPACQIYNNLNFNLVFPTNLWLTNSGGGVSNIQIDAGDGLGYRNIMPGNSLKVSYSDTGRKVWNFKVSLTNGTILQAHSQICVYGTVSTSTPCFTQGCATYVPPGSGGGIQSSVIKTTATSSSIPSDIIVGTYPTYYFGTGETFNGIHALGTVTVQYASGHTSLVNPLIIVEGFDPGTYTMPESITGELTFAGFLRKFSSPSGKLNGSAITNLLLNNYDLVYIDYLNGVADIRQNALLVKSVIRWVNANKTSSNQNVVLGMSMGGLCARYALKKMENAGETHNVRLLMFNGTPQQGVSLPLGIQYFINHLSNLYERSGATSTVYDIINQFDRKLPFLGGLLNLTNAPAAEQMLINHVNYNLQIDNTTHIAWQNELNGLGYPSQGNIQLMTISNGSECGEEQPVGPGGQLFSIDGNFSTGFLGDLAFEFGGSELLSALTLNASYLLGAIPGRNSFHIHFAVNAGADQVSTQVYNGSITYKKTILWLVPVTTTITSVTENSPNGILPYECFGGDYYLIPQLASSSGTGLKGWLYKYNVSVSAANQFGYIPTPSALDIGKGAVSLAESDYTTTYSNTNMPIAPKNTPLNNFITAFNTSLNQNEQHYTFDPRNGNFFAAALNANQSTTPYPADCIVFCASIGIAGSSYACSGTYTYTVPSGTGFTYAWTVPSNLQYISGQGTPILQVQPIISSIATQGTLSVLVSSTSCNTSTTLNQTIYVGAPQPQINITVDRTPEASNYQYLNAVATQLPNTVPSNYQWFQEVNHSTTNLVSMGSGLNINNYPIPPGTAIFFRCVVNTPCGQSISEQYAYNSNSANNAFIVYPNPANNAASISLSPASPTLTATANLSNAYENTITYAPKIPFSYVVYNKIGQALLQGKSDDGSTVQFNTSNLAVGQYFVHIMFGSNTIQKQILISH